MELHYIDIKWNYNDRTLIGPNDNSVVVTTTPTQPNQEGNWNNKKWRNRQMVMVR